MVSLHIDLLIPGVGEIPAVDVSRGVALVLPNQVPSSEDSSSHILRNFEYAKWVPVEVPYIDARLWNGAISDVLDENGAKVGGTRAKARWASVFQGHWVCKHENLQDITRHGHI
jgi:hypothetical protein